MEHDRISVWEDHGDHLSFKEIARAWSKVSADNPKMLMEALVSAFWRGEFESDGQSVLFILLPPDSASSERQPGNYATRGEVVVKVAEDLQSYVTADRKRSPILREEVAYVLWRPLGWRAIVPGYPADFARWPNDKRDSSYPSWRAEHEEVYRAHSTVPMEKWPTTPVDIRYHCSLWCIRRHDFARWYRTSSLSAGAPLDRFWPLQAMDRLTETVDPVSIAASSDVVEGSAPGREPLGPAIHEADHHLFPEGLPKGMSVAERRRRIEGHLKEKHGITGVSNRTFQRYGIKRNTRKSSSSLCRDNGAKR